MSLSRETASGQCSVTLLEPKLIMNMHVLVSLTNAITTYVYGVCVKLL